MCIFLYNFSFSINYVCQYGESLFLLGNTVELGSWDLSKAIEMQWNEGNNWRKYMSFKQTNTTIIHYKYVVCKKNGEVIEPIRWEDGPNRILNLKELTKLFVSLDDIWERRRVSFYLKDQKNRYSSMFLLGNDTELGAMTKPVEMKKVSMICPFEREFQTYWHLEILLPIENIRPKLSYNCITFNENMDRWENIGNESSVQLDFGEGNDEKLSDTTSSLSPEFMKLSTTKIKQSMKPGKKFHGHFLVKIEKNQMGIYQNLEEISEGFDKIYQINEFFYLGGLNEENIQKAIINENVQNILVLTNLPRIFLNNGNESIECLSTTNFSGKKFAVLDLNEDKEYKMKWCCHFLEKAMKNKERTLICWGNSKSSTFKTLIEYFCCFKKFSLEAAKKFLKISSPKKVLKRNKSKKKAIVFSR